MRLLYFGLFSSMGIYFPYVSLYYQAIHLDGAQIGLLASTSALAAVLLPAVWGTLSDRFGWRNQIVRLALGGGAVIAPIIPLLHPFGVLLAAVLLLAVVLSPASPLADAATLECLKGATNRYGVVRLFGSAGFLISSIVIGKVFLGNHILWLFPAFGCALGVAFLTSLAMPKQEGLVRAARGEGLRFVLSDLRVSIFLLLVIVGYTSFAAYNTFFPLYLKDLGAGTDVLGLATALATLSEVAGMVFGGYVIRLYGVKPVLLLGLGSCCVRWLAYAAIRDYHLVFVVQPLHGLGFGAFCVAGVAYVDAIVPVRLRVTGQTLFSLSFMSVSSVIGSNLFGLLYDHIHGSGVFLVAAVLVVPAWLGMATFVPRVGAARSGGSTETLEHAAEPWQSTPV